MFTSIISWIAGELLKWLLGMVEKSIKKHLEDLARDKERKEINEENIKKYEEANDRKKRIEAAIDLLNRSRR